jgi:dienelactone hydrolase
MKRAALLAIIIAVAASRPAAADQYYRESLRIAMPEAGPRGLEALLIRPAGTQRYPLALLSHGAPTDPQERPGMTPYGLYRQAIEFARRGFAALVVMRRGYGDSGGAYSENSCCDLASFQHSAKTSSDDLRAAIAAMNHRTDVTTDGMIAVGTSAGGFASVALTVDPPPGLAAVISFAGGRRWVIPPGRKGIRPSDGEDALVGAFSAFGTTSRTPMLWVYAANDSFFRPDLAQRMVDAFTAGGGQVRLIDTPAFGSDGHFLFSSTGLKIWTRFVDDFLRERNLGLRDPLPPPPLPALQPPSRLGEQGRAAFADYLAAGPHKAFAVSPRGAFGYWSARRSVEDAQERALSSCTKNGSGCALYAIENEKVDANR